MEKIFKVLLVEDNSADARLVREAIAEYGGQPFTIIHVERFSEAATLLELEKKGFDVILLDLSLPDEQGLSTLIRLREITTSIPILILTGTNDEELAMMALKNGAQEYLVKGQADMAALVRIIRYAMERHRIEQELLSEKKRAEDATMIKDKFVSLVAHDLRTPLTGLDMMLKLITMDTEPPLAQKHKTLILQAMQSTESMTALIEDLLNICRIQSGAISLQPRFVDGHFIAMSVIDRLAYQGERKGIKLVNSVPQGHRLYADVNLLTEVVYNLVSNSIKFTKRGGLVTLFAPEAHSGTIAVRDNGIGIDSSVLPNIFKREEKTTTIGTEGEKGTGLGLPLSMDIMNAHNGTLTVESKIGEGSTFHVFLPVIHPKILLVENDKIVRTTFRNLLIQMDVDIAEAENGRNAILLIEGMTPHLIVTGISLPEIDGFALLEFLRKNPTTKLTPVIVITSRSEIEAREKAFKLGADDFLSKPFIAEELIPRIRRFII